MTPGNADVRLMRYTDVALKNTKKEFMVGCVGVVEFHKRGLSIFPV